MIPNQGILINAIVLQEAKLSSEIEIKGLKHVQHVDISFGGSRRYCSGAITVLRHKKVLCGTIRLSRRYSASVTSEWYGGIRPHPDPLPEDGAREMMKHQLMTAQIRVHDLDMDEFLALVAREILARPVREFGYSLSLKVLQPPVGVLKQS